MNCLESQVFCHHSFPSIDKRKTDSRESNVATNWTIKASEHPEQRMRATMQLLMNHNDESAVQCHQQNPSTQPIHDQNDELYSEPQPPPNSESDEIPELKLGYDRNAVTLRQKYVYSDTNKNGVFDPLHPKSTDGDINGIKSKPIESDQVHPSANIGSTDNDQVAQHETNCLIVDDIQQFVMTQTTFPQRHEYTAFDSYTPSGLLWLCIINTLG